MLAYLTTFGEVQQTEKDWIRNSTCKRAKHDQFREHFLKDAKTIFKSLTNTPKTAEQISQDTKISVDTVELYLPFLQAITQYGVITRGPEKYQRTWYLVK
ncbi:MAG: hypothetical protein ACTSYO_00235 [Candidatus Ranarchaeia archaeon]